MPPREVIIPKDKREAILTAASSLFGNYGYRRTSIDDIAQEAGIAKGTVYLYFKGKEEIFRALSQQLLDHMLATAETALQITDPIEHCLAGLLEAKFGYFFELMHRSAHVRELIDAKNYLCADLFAEADRRYFRMLASAIARATEQSLLYPQHVGLDAESAAELLTRSASGIGTYGATSPSLATFRRHLAGLVRVFVVGLGGKIT